MILRFVAASQTDGAEDADYTLIRAKDGAALRLRTVEEWEVDMTDQKSRVDNGIRCQKHQGAGNMVISWAL